MTVCGLLFHLADLQNQDDDWPSGTGEKDRVEGTVENKWKIIDM